MSGEIRFESDFEIILRNGPLQWVRLQGIKVYVKDHWLNDEQIRCPTTGRMIAPLTARIITLKGCQEFILACSVCKAFHVMTGR